MWFLSYDKNGNITDLQRNGRIYGDIQEIDNLVYNYEGNQLMKVTDSSNSTQGFNDGFNQAGVNDYSYDDNGNMIADKNKDIQSIVYNHLNLPTQIIFGNGNAIFYFYNAVGQKVNKNVRTGNEYSDTDYLGGFQYRSSYTEAQGNLGVKELQYFPMAEGYIEHKEGRFFYIYHYTDHLGNIRLSYTYDENVGMIRIMEENHYYPFGLKHESYNTQRLGYTDFINEDEVKEYILQEQPRFVGDGSYNYKYNGKEYQDELGLNWLDYGWRNYDPAISRWVNPDPLLNDLKFTFDDSNVDEDDDDEVYEALITKLETGDGIYNTDNLNPYGYGYNNPVSFEDPDGRCPVCIIVVAALLYSEFANAPSGNNKLDSRNYNASKGNKTIVSETVFKRGSNLIPVTGGKPGSSSAISPSKSKAADKTSQKSNTRNPNGAKGKPDHQAKVKELEKKATKENPGKDIVTEKKIKAENSNRRPDVQVVDPKTGKTTKIYEAERKPNSARNKAREAEYKKLKIPNETHKVGN